MTIQTEMARHRCVLSSGFGIVEIRALLTPDQLAKAQKLKDRVRELRAEMRALFEETAQP